MRPCPGELTRRLHPDALRTRDRACMARPYAQREHSFSRFWRHARYGGLRWGVGAAAAKTPSGATDQDAADHDGPTAGNHLYAASHGDRALYVYDIADDGSLYSDGSG